MKESNGGFTMKKIFRIIIGVMLSLSCASFVFADSLELKPMLISEKQVMEVSYLDEVIKYDIKPQKNNGVTMIPLRETLEKMGYSVKWNGKEEIVEISKGAQWTSVRINNNSYFKNKMMPIKLSCQPIIIDGRTLVPAEFLNVILDKGISVENSNLIINDSEMSIHSGYIKEILDDGHGNFSITLTPDMESENILDYVIIHTSKETTYYNCEFKKGDYINSICNMAMTMSIPGQTSAYILY